MLIKHVPMCAKFELYMSSHVARRAAHNNADDNDGDDNDDDDNDDNNAGRRTLRDYISSLG